jgi:type I restriction enzyme S subunit
MASEWQPMTLRAANVTLIDCDHRTPPAAEDGYPYVAIPQMRGGRIELAGARRICREHYLEWTRKAKPSANDVILSRRCNPGETAIAPASAEFALGQNLVLLRADGTKVYPPFLRWLVRGPDWWEQIGKFNNVGAVFDSLKCADVPKFELRIPPLPEQRAIAHILGTLDDKIELNRRRNETLEAMARALFKSWFVDFDPVRAKVEGRDPRLPKPLADLFPARLVDSELGEIPEGWEVGPLDSVVVLQRGFDLPAMERTSGAYPVLAASGPSGTHNEFMVRGPGVTTGRSGVLGKVFYVAEDYWPLNTSLWVKEFRHSRPAYAFHLLRALDFALFNAGSAVPTLNRNHVHTLPTLLPPMRLIDAFERFATGCLARQRSSDQQATTLARMRDALLPQLISGELPVNRAERFVVEGL